MPVTVVRKQRAFKGRSRKGCLTCISRRIKCDEGRPSCGNCLARGKPCEQRETSALQEQTRSQQSRPLASISAIPPSLDHPLPNAHGLFKRINASTLPNFDSLIYWSKAPNDSDGQAHGALDIRNVWVDLLTRQGQQDVATLGLASYFVLKQQQAVTGIDTSHGALRAELSVIQALRSCKKPNGLTLLAITCLVLVAALDEDYTMVAKHLRALARLYTEDMKIEPLEWIFIWGFEHRIAASLLRIPLLPYFIPKALQKPYPLPSEEILGCHRLANENAVAISHIVKEDYLATLQILQLLHIAFKTYSDCSRDIHMDQSMYGRLYEVGYRCQVLFDKAKRAASKSKELSFAIIYRQLLPMALQLTSYQTAVRFLRHEGVIQTNVLKYAKQLMLPHRELKTTHHRVVHHSGKDGSEGLIWIFTTFILQSAMFCPDDVGFWIEMLQGVLHSSGLASKVFYLHKLQNWPHDAIPDEAMLEAIWTPVASGDANADVEVDPAKLEDRNIVSFFLLWEK